MPPKKQIERAAILDRAFEITRRNGFETITARSLASSLNCSTQPIYQSFTDMKALEREVAQRSFSFMLDHLNLAADTLPRDLSFVLNYIRFALEEKHLFRLIAQNGLFATDAQAASSSIPPIDQKLSIFANGVVFMTAFQSLQWSWPEIRKIVTAAYDDFRKGGT